MKKLLFFSTVILACLVSCQKTETQADPGMASADAVTTYNVGIPYSGTYEHGSAYITSPSWAFSFTPITEGVAKPGQQIDIHANPNSGYVVDYWWHYNYRPDFELAGSTIVKNNAGEGGKPILKVKKEKVHQGEQSFTHIMAAEEAWFEPVFQSALVMGKVEVGISPDDRGLIEAGLRYNGNSYTSLALPAGKQVIVYAVPVLEGINFFGQWKKRTIRRTLVKTDTLNTIEYTDSDTIYYTTVAGEEVRFEPIRPIIVPVD